MSGSITPTMNVDSPPMESLQFPPKPKFFSFPLYNNPFRESGGSTTGSTNATSNTNKSSTNLKGVIQPPPAADGLLSPPPLNHTSHA